MIHTQCRGLEYDVYDLGDALHKVADRVMKEMIRTSIQILTHLLKSIYLRFQYTYVSIVERVYPFLYSWYFFKRESR